MRIKSTNLFAMVLLTGIMSFATTESAFYPYASSAFNIYDSAGAPIQDWIPAQMITLNVSAGSTVYLTNYVSSWFGDMPNLGDADYAAGYDMSANKYGYVFAQKDTEGNVSTLGDIHWADGSTKEITYQNPDGPQTRTTTGYLLDTFENDAEIFFVMTPNGYEETVNSYDPVNDPDDNPAVESILASRQINTVDLAGNVRVNFGTVDKIGHEFVIGSEATPPTTGQPLPSMLLCGLLSLGTASAASRLRKRSRK